MFRGRWQLCREGFFGVVNRLGVVGKVGRDFLQLLVRRYVEVWVGQVYWVFLFFRLELRVQGFFSEFQLFVDNRVVFLFFIYIRRKVRGGVQKDESSGFIYCLVFFRFGVFRSGQERGCGFFVLGFYFFVVIVYLF